MFAMSVFVFVKTSPFVLSYLKDGKGIVHFYCPIYGWAYCTVPCSEDSYTESRWHFPHTCHTSHHSLICLRNQTDKLV